MKLDKKILAVIATGVSASSASAMAIAIEGNTSDAEATSNISVGAGGNGLIMSGAWYGAGPGLAATFVFELPTLAPGESFGTASLNINLAAVLGVPSFNGDLVGIRSDSSSSVLGSDYSAPGVVIHNDFLTSSSTTGIQTSNDFAAWLNTQTPGEFVFIKVNPDVDTSSGFGSSQGFRVSAADNVTVSERPVLNVTVVPEPSSTALLGLGGLALVLRRRK